jgi:hypothetical protein
VEALQEVRIGRKEHGERRGRARFGLSIFQRTHGFFGETMNGSMEKELVWEIKGRGLMFTRPFKFMKRLPENFVRRQVS